MRMSTQMGRTPNIHTEKRLSDCVAMAGGGEGDRLGDELRKSVHSPQHASSAPLSIHTALFPLFWSLSISGVFAAFEYGDGRTPSHASLCMNDSLLCSGTFEAIQGSLRSHLSKHVSVDTPLPGTLPTECHAHAHAMCACSMC